MMDQPESSTNTIAVNSQEEHRHLQGAVAAQAQEGQEELFHIQGQEWRLWGDTPHPR